MRPVIRLLASICCSLVALHAPPAEARRVALVIGNAAYKIGPLANPLNDAAAVAQAFEAHLKFDKVILKTNLGSEGFRAALAELSREVAGADLGVVYFAGHGTEVNGKNFLIPVDAALARPGALDLEAIPLDTVLGQLEGVRRLKLVILDACRNNLFALPGAKRTVSRGLARIEPEDNTLVVYAARDGTTADDGVGRRHSPFTEALLKHIATPGLEINFVFRRVRDEVVAATNPVQTPHIYGTLGSKEFYLQPHAGSSGNVLPPPTRPSSEAAEAWDRTKDATSVVVLEAFIRRFGDTYYGDLARARLAEIQAAAKIRADEDARAKAEAERKRQALSDQEAKEPKLLSLNVAFRAGIWRIMRTSRLGAGEIYLWTDNGSLAVEVTLDSNGWWRIRQDARERVVFPMGPADAQSFEERPWLRAGSATHPVANAVYKHTNSHGTMSVEVTDEQILISMTNGSRIRLNTRDRRIIFTSLGRSFTF